MKKFILILMVFLLVGCSNTYEVNYGDLTLKLDKETASNIKDDELILNGNNYYASIKIYNDYKYEEINETTLKNIFSTEQYKNYEISEPIKKDFQNETYWILNCSKDDLKGVFVYFQKDINNYFEIVISNDAFYHDYPSEKAINEVLTILKNAKK